MGRWFRLAWWKKSIVFLSCLRLDIIIKYESKVLDTKIEEILHFYSKDLTSQIVRDEPQINDIQSYDILGNVSDQSPRLN